MLHKFLRAAREADIYWLSPLWASGKPRQTVRSETKKNKPRADAHEAARKGTEATVLGVMSTWS